MKKIKYIKQTDLRDCGVSCLMSLVRYYDGNITREYLRNITKTTKDGVSAYSLIEAGEKIGFEVKAIKSNVLKLNKDVPLIAHVIINKKYGHFVVITKINNEKITIMDPSSGFKTFNLDEWEKITTNVYLLYKPKTEILKQNKEMSFKDIFIPIINKYKKTFIILIIFSLIYTICNILISYQFEFFLNLITSNNLKTINIIFYFLIIIILLKEITNLFRNNLVNYINHNLDKTLIQEVYNHIIRLPYLYFKNRTKGDIITRIQDIFTIRDVISKLFLTITIDLILLIFLIVVLFKISIKLSIISFIITILYILFQILYNHVIDKKINIVKEKETLINNHLIETFTSINTLKGMQIEDMLFNDLKCKYHDYQENSFSLYKNYYQELFFKNLVYGIGMLIIIYIGIKDVLNGNISLAKLLVFNSLIVYYFNPIQNITNLQFELKDANISFIRIKELLSIECEKLVIDKKKLNKRLKGNICIKNLEYSYNGISDVIKCEHLEIKDSNHVLLYGISGGGKSTLMKLLCRYIDNYKGEILIDNRNLFNYNLLDIRNKITYLSQDEVIYTDTIYNNIVLKHDIKYSKYLEIVKLTGVDEIIKRSILKDDMLLDNNGSNLSGGEIQRILLARCLVKDSDIYIFDESFSALDIKSERRVLKNILNYLKNKTVIVISHRFNNRDLYQKYILIEKGIVYEY